MNGLADSWALSLRAKNRSPNTISSYLLCLRLLIEFCEAEGLPTDPAKMTRTHVEKFIGHQLATRSANTAGIRYRSLFQFFKWLEAEEEVERSPMSAMTPPVVPEVPIPVVSDGALRKLLGASGGKSFRDRRDTAIIRLFIDTPARLSEVTNLLVSDVDLDAQTITVTAKGNKRETKPFGPQSAAALDRYLRARRSHRWAGSERLWLGTRGPMTRYGIPQMIERRCKEAGIERLHVHQLRHTFAHDWLARGGSEQNLMSLAGWRSRAMVAKYGKALAEERAREDYKNRLPGERI